MLVTMPLHLIFFRQQYQLNKSKNLPTECFFILMITKPVDNCSLHYAPQVFIIEMSKFSPIFFYSIFSNLKRIHNAC